MKVKVCCISSEAEARLAIAAGAAALGLVGPMPSGPGILSLDTIAKIVSSLPPTTNTFFLTAATNAEEIIKQHQIVQTSTIQIVDELKSGSLKDLKIELPETNIVQVVHVVNETSIDSALEKAEQSDFLLLDSGNPNLKIKELGGTGRTHNWTISRKIVEQSPIPVFLAGGLDPNNVQQAIQQVAPHGLDLCSGLRTNRLLDAAKLQAFFGKVEALKR